MTERENELLKMAYDALRNNQRCAQFSYYAEDGMRLDNSLIVETDNALDMLEGADFIEKLNSTLGSQFFKITALGRDYIEGNLPEEQPTYIINQGDQSINIVGSQNTISNNYNQFLSEVKALDVPEETIKLVEALLYDLQNPHIDRPSKLERIKTFLPKLMGTAIPASASTVLTSLITNYLGI